MVRRGPAPGSRDWSRQRGGGRRRDRGARHRKGWEQPDPKPFLFVAVKKDTCPDRRLLDEKDLHDRIVHDRITARFELELEVVSDYLFVGSGGWEVTKDGRAYRTFYRRNDQICVPATSIKGAVRAVYEAITNSCVSQIDPKDKKKPPKGHLKCKFKRGNEPLCPACRLFGTTGYAGRIRFSDALPVGGTIRAIVQVYDLFKPKPDKWEGRKFYAHGRASIVDGPPQRSHHFVEAVVGNTEFQTKITIFNAGDTELAALFVSIGLLDLNGKRIMPKIGGAKPRCFGTVRFELLNGKDWEGRAIQREELFAELRNALSLVDVEAFNKLTDATYKLPHCPRRNYR